MLWIFHGPCQRDLMRAECAFDGYPIHFLRAGPSLGRAKDDHGPDGLHSETVLARLLLNCPDLGIAIVKGLGQKLMHNLRTSPSTK